MVRIKVSGVQWSLWQSRWSERCHGCCVFSPNEQRNQIFVDSRLLKVSVGQTFSLKTHLRALCPFYSPSLVFSSIKTNHHRVCYQELQRRLDQTLGKPGSYLAGIDRVGNVKPMTVGARLYRVEQQLAVMDKKLDQLIHSLNMMTHQQPKLPPAVGHMPPPVAGTSQSLAMTMALQVAPHMTMTTTSKSSQAVPPLVPLASIEDDV